jgi:hypothetical protein
MMQPGAYLLSQRFLMRDRDVLYIGNARANQLTKFVQQPSSETAYELALGKRRRLEVKPAYRSNPYAERLVFLDKLDVAGPLGETVQPEDFGEIAAFIFDLARNDFERPFDFKTAKIHSLFRLGAIFRGA